MKLSQRNMRVVVTLLIVIGLAVGGAVLFRRTDFSFLRSLTARSLVYIAPLFVLYQTGAVLAHVLLLRDMGYPVKVARLAPILFASYSSNLAGVAKVGTPVRIYLLRQVSGVPLSIGTSATAVLYSVELAITTIIALAGFGYFVPEATRRSVAWLAVTVALIVALSVFFGLSRRKEVRLPGLWRRLGDFVTQVRDGMGKTTVATLGALVGLALAKRLMLALTSYLVLNDLGNHLPLKGLIFLQSSAILVGFASMIPLGLGTRDLTTFLLYARLGLRPEVSVAMAAIERAIWTLVPFCLGLVCAALIGLSRRLYGELGRKNLA